MARFTYTAERHDGETYQGVAEARDRFELYGIVRQEGGRVVRVEEDTKNSMMSVAYWNTLVVRVSEYDKILFARNLGAMLSAGLSLARALAVMERQTKNQKLARIISDVSNAVRRGDAFHVALTKHSNHFSKLFIAMVRAGEEGGDLPAALAVISEQMERMYTLKKKVQGALMYPSIVVIAMLGIGVLMMTQVVPTLAQTFKEMNADLPPTTLFIIGVSDFLVRYTLLAVLGTFALIASVYVGVRTKPGKRLIDAIFLHIPVIGGIVREVNAARTARTLSSLLSSGVDVITALGIVEEVVQNSYFRDVVATAARGVAKGEALSVAFARREDLYPAFVGEMMAVGEETGQTTDMLKRLAGFYEDEVDRKTKDMSTIIEPFLMVIIGAGVGFFALSMISPIYSLSENI